ncbi:MAG: VWA domain-containing protein [Acidobacteria bacterium]|nr:VWA domain-containing protein [Acidobacteriota bacterium]
MGLLRPRLLTRILSGAVLLASVGLAPVAAPPSAGPAAAGPPPEAAGEAGGVAVRFVEPAAPGLILGPTRITVEAEAPAGARIARVEIYADGALLSVLERPPYTLTWDAGTGFLHRTLRAVATDSTGRTGETTLVARPFYVGQYEEVRLVSVFATARDRRGNPVLDLGKGDFILLEDGAPQTVTHFTSAKVPITIALLIDASNSMNLGGRIDLARKAAAEFVDSVDPEDRLLVLSFNDDLQGGNTPVADRDAGKKVIEGIRARGGTALYDAIHQAAGRLAGSEGRRVIVLLSDGRDQALTDNEPGSLHLFEEALEKAHRSEVAVYAIGLGPHLDTEMDLRHERSLKEILDALARTTGGRSYYPARAGQLSGVYRQIAADLKAQYTLAYTPANRAADGKWRTITLKAKDPDLEVRARAGYYAPAPASR